MDTKSLWSLECNSAWGNMSMSGITAVLNQTYIVSGSEMEPSSPSTMASRKLPTTGLAKEEARKVCLLRQSWLGQRQLIHTMYAERELWMSICKRPTKTDDKS